MSIYRPAPGATEVVPACDLCGGGESVYGLSLWSLLDPKLEEHERHDTGDRWVTDIRLPFPHGRVFKRDTPEARAIYEKAVANVKRHMKRLEAIEMRTMRQRRLVQAQEGLAEAISLLLEVVERPYDDRARDEIDNIIAYTREIVELQRRAR